MFDDWKELSGRVERGEASPDEIARFEQMLESEAFEVSRQWVRSLPEDTPSLEWRSRLNERVQKMAPRRARPAWFVRPAWGLALAGAIALAVWRPWTGPDAPLSAPPAPSLEASLVSAHLEYVQSAELAGAGLLPQDLGASHSASPVASPYDWVEADLAL